MTIFKNVLITECKKATHNKFFVIALSIGIVLNLLSALYCIERYFELQTILENQYSQMMVKVNPMIQSEGLYNNWIGGEVFSFGFGLFFTLFPILALMGYGWSHSIETSRRYTKMAVILCGRKRYFLAKYIATFLSGGFIMVAPLAINFIVTACFIPAVHPTILYPNYGMDFGSMWSELFYINPLVFVILYLILDFVFAGLFATFGLACSFFTKISFISVIVPYLIILLIHYSRTFLHGKLFLELSPLNFLHPLCVENQVSGVIVMLEGMLFFIIPFSIVMKEGFSREIY